MLNLLKTLTECAGLSSVGGGVRVLPSGGNCCMGGFAMNRITTTTTTTTHLRCREYHYLELSTTASVQWLTCGVPCTLYGT